MNNPKVRMGPEPEETKIHETIRLRNEAAAAEQQGKHLLNVALLFKDGKQYDDAIENGKSLLEKAVELREQAKNADKNFAVNVKRITAQGPTPQSTTH
jgi:hypothetical protein